MRQVSMLLKRPGLKQTTKKQSKMEEGCEFKLNHLVFMDDVKRFGKFYEQTDSLVPTVRTLSTAVWMKFVIKKCGVLVLKRGKIAKMEGVVLPVWQVLKDIEERVYRYLGILETEKLKEKEVKDLCWKEYKRSLKLVLKSKLSGENKITAGNAMVQCWCGRVGDC